MDTLRSVCSIPSVLDQVCLCFVGNTLGVVNLLQWATSWFYVWLLQLEMHQLAIFVRDGFHSLDQICDCVVNSSVTALLILLVTVPLSLVPALTLTSTWNTCCLFIVMMFVVIPFDFPVLKVHSLFVQPSDDEASSEISEEGNDTDCTVGVSGEYE